ncbi:putative NADH oxidoreductase [Actinobacillus pleuropneumoniae]|nr:putative NADH oxidoreductase [Actinobacillus pleuropneumoniae]KIE89169.1 putative NADH oxidoreductase [Actinobacillus pleuropneumoniae]KIE89275.1 NADH oxidoreductase [Actinobacillus pleuropneumoniae]KIE94509.1 NADH oxidoreductase [Actinobacillus pleuropneumoniae]KIE95510.1 putative NADH oxidoreductase [Actinobacillus pleuropneumoniae]
MANTNKNPLCINELQVYSIVQETPHVKTINFIAQDFYPYQAGQYALVSIKNTPHITRAYSLSSTPGESVSYRLPCVKLKAASVRLG